MSEAKRQIVSNPWREAIEGMVNKVAERLQQGFQSLEGGY